MPSPDYRSAGHGADYGNKQGTPQLGLNVVAMSEDGSELKAVMSLKSARNEGISVQLPSNNLFVSVMRGAREISAYIPGVAGIPLVEEKRSKLIVHRSAAAGDANTVLRNMLDLLRNTEVAGKNGLGLVEELVTKVMGDFELKVDFNDARHTRVHAQFRTGDMMANGDRGFRPLELAGIGYLQVLQIFCYLVYFRPVLLLVDEPDAHLYPIAQERLVEVLSEAATEFDAQILLTTHSPSIVRALPQNSKVIWMKEGKVEPGGDARPRQLMGWGLLDRKIILLTEDSRTDMLRSILGQWPDLERVTAVWPFHGTGKLPTPETLSGFQSLVGDQVKIVIHRDRDFLMPLEVEKVGSPYVSEGSVVWFTKYSDVESYWGSSDVVAKYFGVDGETALDLIHEAVQRADANDEASSKRRTKRNDVVLKLNRNGSLPQYGDMEVLQEATRDGPQYAVLGKTLLAKIREVANERDLPEANKFGKSIPQPQVAFLANDLSEILRSAMMSF